MLRLRSCLRLIPSSLKVLAALTLLSPLLTAALHAQATAPVTAFNALAPGASQTQTVTFTYSGTSAVASVSVMTQGTTGLDFQQTAATTSNCVNAAPVSGAKCTVSVTFSPLGAGLRTGAAVLWSGANGTGTRLAIAYLNGIGQGAQLVASGGNTTTVFTTGGPTAYDAVVDAAGNVYAAEDNQVVRYSTQGVTTVCSCGFILPFQLAVDGAGLVYVADAEKGTISRVDFNTLTATVLETLSASVYAVALDASANVYYATPTSNGANPSNIYYLAPGSTTPVLVGQDSNNNGSGVYFTINGGLTVDSARNVYFTDSFDNFSKLPYSSGTWGAQTNLSSGFLGKMVTDGANNVYINSGAGIKVYSPATGTITNIPVPSTLQKGLGLASNGDLYATNDSTTVSVLHRSGVTFAPSGTTALSSTSAEQTYSVTNIGPAAATITSVTNSANVKMGPSATCTGAVPTAGCTASVEFAPIMRGSPQSGTQTIGSNPFSPLVFNVTGYVAGDATKLAITQAPPSALSAGGNVGTLAVQVQDNASNVVTTSSAPVTLNVTSSNGYAQAYTVNAVSGVATFNLSGAALTQASTYLYAFSSGSFPAVSALTTVSPQPVYRISVVPSQTSLAAGSSDALTLSAFDVYGNPVSYTGTVAFTSTDPQAVLPAPATFTGGAATASITFVTPGHQTVTATDTARSTLNGISPSITVTAPPKFIVTSTADDNTGVCTNQTASGATADANCQLRSAINAVNALNSVGLTATVPILTFSPTVFTAGTTITVKSSLPAFSANAAVIGLGPSLVTVNGSGVYDLLGQTTPNTITTLSAITLKLAGNPSSALLGSAWTSTANPHVANFSNVTFSTNYQSYSGNSSGALYDQYGTVTIQGSTFSRNNFGDGTVTGGAVQLANGTAQISGSAFSANIGYLGGALALNNGTLTITNSTFGSANSADANTAGLGGGAIAVLGTSTLTVNGVSFTGNQINLSGPGGGGAIYVQGGSSGKPVLSVTNSLFNGNQVSSTATAAPAYGGAIYIPTATSATYAQTVTLTNNTFVANKVTNSANTTSATYAEGGAIYASGANSNLSLYNNTITGNYANAYATYTLASAKAYNNIIIGNLLNGTLTTLNRDAISAVTGQSCSTVSTLCYTGNVQATEATDTAAAKLSALGNFGGQYPSILPLPGSSALQLGITAVTGNLTSLPATDARGLARLAPNGKLDFGAVQTNYTLAYTQQPTNTMKAVAITPAPAVQVFESGVPLAATGSGTLTLTASEGTLTGNSAAVNATGLATFSASSITTEQANEVLTAGVSNGSTNFITVASNPFLITGPISFLTAPPATIVANTNPGPVTIGLYASGAVDTTTSASVTLTVTGPNSYSATYGPTATTHGQVTFTQPVLTAPGTYTYTATASAYTPDSALALETVAAQALGSFSVTGIPSLAVPNAPYNVQVSALDTTGAAFTGYTGTVTLTSSDPAAQLPATYTFEVADAGIHSFPVVLETPGIQSVTATAPTGTTGSEIGILVTGFVDLVNNNGTTVRLDADGNALITSGTAGTTATRGGLAVNSAGTLFSVTNTSASVSVSTSTGSAQTPLTGAGLSAPVSVAVDGAGSIWIANSGNNTLSEFLANGTAQSPTTGFGTSDPLNAPSSLVLDNTGGVWVTSKSGNSITHVFGAAAPVVTPTAGAVSNNTVGVRP